MDSYKSKFGVQILYDTTLITDEIFSIQEYTTIEIKGKEKRMNAIILNETPVRTSKNFNINNIRINDISIPEEILEFKNVEASIGVIENNIEKVDLAYGIGDILIKQIKEKSNKKLKILVSKKTDKEIKINFKFNKNNIHLVENIEIDIEDNAEGKIIIQYEADEDNEYYHNGLIRVNAKSNSNLDIVILNLMNLKSNNFLTIDNLINNNAKIKFTIVDFGGKNSVTNYYSNLKGENSDNILNTIYLGSQDQLFDLNYISELRGKRSNINIEVQGALLENAKKSFKGTIDFKKGSKKATGNENENCMLLSNTAKSLALPMLLCSEEDVEGTHSTSAGKINPRELFYIMSRGFEFKEAMKLMVRARFNKILDEINNKEIIGRVLYEIDKKLKIK